MNTAIYGDELTEGELTAFVHANKHDGSVVAIATAEMITRLDLLMGDKVQMVPASYTYAIHARQYQTAAGSLNVMKVTGEGEVMLAVTVHGVLRR